MTDSPGPVFRAVEARRSHPSVGGSAPSDDQLRPLIAAAGAVADHGALRPWRVIALRGEARERLGAAIAVAAGLEGPAAEKLAAKPLRAPLLLAIVASPTPSFKVPDWEQEAVAAGVAHTLSLLLDEEGWGVIWRTGIHTRSAPVATLHGLAEGERLLGWLYVGERLPDAKTSRRAPIDVDAHFGTI
ncbi:nitroreductase [uncultured Schumannella sp.]|uniref:nitroreductase family protein n=1 Tax=uncultured Schumannella sp. TaxID=1195956 RepID=UPI0025DCFCE6|nr:nitroreductase [uncultured Schumannella sp.]